MTRERSNHPCTVVIKLGSSSIVHEKTHQPLLSTLSSVVETVVSLRAQGHKVVLVSSGAIAVGLQRMDLPSRPKTLAGKQALAAIGQGRLIGLWDDLFRHLGQPIAQILLTRGDISDRTRYLNAVNTLQELLSMGVVPIVNENDTVSVSEIKFGDNDTLSAITSSMIHADYLFLLTDVDGLYTANPRKDPDAKHIELVTSISAIREKVSTTTLGSSLGTGGMETKIIAAEIATGAGVLTIITSSKSPSDIAEIMEYHNAQRFSLGATSPAENNDADTAPTADLPRPRHTAFAPSPIPLRDLKSWTRHTLFPSGSVVVDTGAHSVLSRRESGGRLLAAGVLGVIGAFASGQAVRVVTPKHRSVYEHLIATEAAGVHSTGSTRPTTPSIVAASSVSSSVASLEPLSRSGSFNVLSEAVTDKLAEPEEPQFQESEVVEIGRGLAMYNSAELTRIKGLKSTYIPQVLGYADSEYVVENITIHAPP
ncbi:glutamate 5-kinase [Cylindrobasidium torrendii FP15055 ss-10]|uniref:Glutamate 5-kinase n=1 Tax=Cylindrobasidium torrendii FP15055 ss-10 TaxID=1314674 RepID=A0A0D7BW86_9AGAR|nr:glutamate 5-kinase [Cylindrobasidium torrendii FP15055 ss-10]